MVFGSCSDWRSGGYITQQLKNSSSKIGCEGMGMGSSWCK